MLCPALKGADAVVQFDEHAFLLSSADGKNASMQDQKTVIQSSWFMALVLVPTIGEMPGAIPGLKLRCNSCWFLKDFLSPVDVACQCRADAETG